jgi:hypothetical protein
MSQVEATPDLRRTARPHRLTTVRECTNRYQQPAPTTAATGTTTTARSPAVESRCTARTRIHTAKPPQTITTPIRRGTARHPKRPPTASATNQKISAMTDSVQEGLRMDELISNESGEVSARPVDAVRSRTGEAEGRTADATRGLARRPSAPDLLRSPTATVESMSTIRNAIELCRATVAIATHVRWWRAHPKSRRSSPSPARTPSTGLGLRSLAV